jgi:hypothetical protein
MSSMRHSDRTEAPGRTTPNRPPDSRAQQPVPSAVSPGPSPANALALQRTVGNRAASRLLARWSKHPDEREKGKLLSDEAAVDYMHFNVPLNK